MVTATTISPPSIVLDTNVLVAAAYSAASASRRIVEACLRGKYLPLVSSALRSEYDFILRRAVRHSDYDAKLQQLVASAIQVEPKETPRVVPDDPADDMLIALARAGQATAILTNDRHLLQLDLGDDVRIVSPSEFISHPE